MGLREYKVRVPQIVKIYCKEKGESNMPLYDFVCQCGYTKEAIVKSEDTYKPVCDVCGLEMKRAMSAPAFILKGSCWYSDGYSYSTKKNSGGKKDEKRV